MWNDTIYWWIGTIIYTLISMFKEKLFDKNIALSKDKNIIIKTKEKYIKTVKQQKDYIRAKSNLGQDFIIMVFSIIIFYIAFITLLYPRIPNIGVGIIVVIIFSAIFSFIYTKYLTNSVHFWHNMINAFMNKAYVGFFLIYIKFFHTIHPLFLLLGSIAIMLGINYFAGWINGRLRKGM